MKRKEVAALMESLKKDDPYDRDPQLVDQVCLLLTNFMRYVDKTEQALVAADKLMTATRDVRGADNVALRDRLSRLIDRAGQMSDIYDANRRAQRGIA